jgi:hypothetical protein
VTCERVEMENGAQARRTAEDSSAAELAGGEVGNADARRRRARTRAVAAGPIQMN